MRVYRVEHKAGRHGPYAGYGQNRKHIQEMLCVCENADVLDHDDDCEYLESVNFHERLMWDGSIARPAPRDDGLYRIEEETRFGFESLKALWEWFDEFLDDLDRFGYMVVEYEVYGWYAVGKFSGQVAYDSREAGRVS